MFPCLGRSGLILLLSVLVACSLPPGFGDGGFAQYGAAHAQDDDDDDGDDGDDDDDGGSVRSGGDRDRQMRAARPANPAATRRMAAAPAAAPRPANAPDEIVVTDLAAADLALLLAEGFAVIEDFTLTDVALTLHRLRIPPGLTLIAARDRVRAQPSGTTGDFNHYYRSEQAEPEAAVAEPCTHLNCRALAQIGWPADRAALEGCRVTVPVGVIDTGINRDHENLTAARIEVIRLADDALDPSLAVHGTAVVSLLAGRADGRAPGLVPEAPLIAVDVFGRAGGDERAGVVALIRALDVLASRSVRVINMSLSGPPNVALEAALMRITGPGGALVLAAAGNGGPEAGPAYPAGYGPVVAVTAVDGRDRIYRRAQRGPHLDLAAPGVGIWSATSLTGVKAKTGTSFAVPFATAAAAVLASRAPAPTPAALAGALGVMVRDIGAPGADEVFGAGLLALDRLCATDLLAVQGE